ncbi:MAG TPA: LysR family transcriptional regulator, partial [Pseudomonas sp.]|nr:LysR family transcriptional regulator [Pseudomonas sp.]
PRGRLRVHSTTGLGIQLLSGLAGHYCERYPEVSLDLSLSQRQPDLLEAGLDVIITLSRDLPDSELIAQRLGPVFHVVCAAPSYLQRHGVPRRP